MSEVIRDELCPLADLTKSYNLSLIEIYSIAKNIGIQFYISDYLQSGRPVKPGPYTQEEIEKKIGVREPSFPKELHIYIKKEHKNIIIQYINRVNFSHWMQKDIWTSTQCACLFSSMKPGRAKQERKSARTSEGEIYKYSVPSIQSPITLRLLHERIRTWPMVKQDRAHPFAYINHAIKKNTPIPEELRKISIEQFNNEYGITSDEVAKGQKIYPFLAKEAKIKQSKQIDINIDSEDLQTTRERKKEEKYKIIIAAFIQLLIKENNKYKQTQDGASHKIGDPNFSEIYKGIEAYLYSGDLEDIKGSNGGKLGLTEQALRKLFPDCLKLHNQLCEALSKLD